MVVLGCGVKKTLFKKLKGTSWNQNKFLSYSYKTLSHLYSLHWFYIFYICYLLPRCFQFPLLQVLWFLRIYVHFSLISEDSASHDEWGTQGGSLKMVGIWCYCSFTFSVCCHREVIHFHRELFSLFVTEGWIGCMVCGLLQ